MQFKRKVKSELFSTRLSCLVLATLYFG